MKENVLDVLLYLFENYMIEGARAEPDQESLASELSQAGFEQGDIGKAFDWLEGLSVLCTGGGSAWGGTEFGIRHYSPEERSRIDLECRGYIEAMQRNGVIDAHSRELVIDRLMALDGERLELEHVKWVTTMVLCGTGTHDGAIALDGDDVEVRVPLH